MSQRSSLSRRLAATFALAANLLSGCATTREEACDNVTAIKEKAGVNPDGSTNLAKKTAADIAFTTPILGPVLAATYGFNKRKCDQIPPPPNTIENPRLF